MNWYELHQIIVDETGAKLNEIVIFARPETLASLRSVKVDDKDGFVLIKLADGEEVIIKGDAADVARKTGGVIPIP